MDTYNIEMPIDLKDFHNTVKTLVMRSAVKSLKDVANRKSADTIRCIGFVNYEIDTIGEMKIYPSDVSGGIFRSDGKFRAQVQRFMNELSTSHTVQIEIFNEEDRTR